MDMSIDPDFNVEEPYPGWAEEDNGPLLLGVMGAMTGLAIVFVIARIYSRLILLGRLGFDDYILIISVVSSSPSPRAYPRFWVRMVVILTRFPRSC
jgi:hypothetical protein